MREGHVSSEAIFPSDVKKKGRKIPLSGFDENTIQSSFVAMSGYNKK